MVAFQNIHIYLLFYLAGVLSIEFFSFDRYILTGQQSSSSSSSSSIWHDAMVYYYRYSIPSPTAMYCIPVATALSFVGIFLQAIQHGTVLARFVLLLTAFGVFLHMDLDKGTKMSTPNLLVNETDEQVLMKVLLPVAKQHLIFLMFILIGVPLLLVDNLLHQKGSSTSAKTKND